MKPQLKILVIGCGSIGERHIRNLQSLNIAEIIACDQSQERLKYIKAEYGIEVFPDYREVLASKTFDAVLVCTPTDNHIAPALAAIRHGCHVFVEKPISHTLEGVDSLIKEAGRKNLILMTGFNYRFHPDLLQIKQLMDTGAIGRPISARANFGSYFLYRVPFHAGKDYRQDYAAQEVGGGVILDMGSHIIDLLHWFFDEVKEVFCYSERMGNLDIKAEDFAEILLKFKKGPVASIHADFIQQPYQIKCEIIGDKGTISWDYTERKVMLLSAASNKKQEIKVENKSNDMHLEEIKHFIKCVEGKDKPVADGAAGRRVLEIALAAKKSAVTGRVVKL